jgi:hypothetical protein
VIQYVLGCLALGVVFCVWAWALSHGLDSITNPHKVRCGEVLDRSCVTPSGGMASEVRSIPIMSFLVSPSFPPPSIFRLLLQDPVSGIEGWVSVSPAVYDTYEVGDYYPRASSMTRSLVCDS